MNEEFPIFYEINNSGWYSAFWVSCTPPELDMSDDWVDSLPVPDAEEMAQMDESADALWFDLMGETI